MDKHQSISRNGSGAQSYNINTPELETYETPPQAKFNIPDELMMESKPSQQIPQASSKDRILNSKLPDEIKRLMIENPIVATNPLSPSNSVLSDELVEKASRLMGTKKSQSSPTQISEQKTPINSDLKKMMKEVVEEVPLVKVSVHQIENPYVVKADILVYPTNNVLTIDDVLLNRLSYNAIQKECDKIPKPINMGSVYVTSNGGENSKVQPKQIIHAVVAGESRLVNEADIKLATRKALHLAKESNVRNIVMLPPDCGTHDIQDAARVQLSSIYTFLQTEKDIPFKNIFIVMEDKESFDVYQEYYKRVFKSR
jgi:O-acetyl-ADP-ribose deacetylase (regulator of RNase III)